MVSAFVLMLQRTGKDPICKRGSCINRHIACVIRSPLQLEQKRDAKLLMLLPLSYDESNLESVKSEMFSQI